ncbi:zinc finger protein [Macleaya cordata]|uniref:Zinc finger protein n=1 Tax=Macleaya cordata TaxID=56857 RepID=A0A200R2K9_MACCD|nr:zinc finger protein [Macleaya cordata]
MSDGGNAFGKTICTICYEDLKPLIEDLQSISICGHVFHELCLQQWLEYCNAKKTTCPVCKQKCCQDNISRLYFQSIGDPNELIISQKSSIRGRGEDEEEDPVLLRKEVKKLEAKLSGLSTAFERQQQDLKELNEELCICKEEAKTEAVLKNEALQQKALIQKSLKSRSEELVKAESECSKLQQRNMALAKELAALKLVSDLNLEEEEVLKLASFGHGTNNKDTIDVLKKSLVLRNKSYKELMAQCNLLGRGETRSLKKLEKAKEKMKKLKTRVHELEMALEEKENEVLRALKTSKKTSREGVDVNGVKRTSNFPGINKCPSEDQMEQSTEPLPNSNQSGGLTNHPSQFTKTGSSDLHKDVGFACKKATDIIDIDPVRGFSSLTNQNSSELYPAVLVSSSSFLKPQTNANFSEDISLQKSCVSRPKSASDTKTGDSMHGQNSRGRFPGSNIGAGNDVSNVSVGAMEEDEMQIGQKSSGPDIVILDKITSDPPLPQIRKEASCPVPTSTIGEQCFAGGLIGPDGANRYLGKWCKRTQSDTPQSSSPVVQESGTSVGDLIAAGADGRGGRIKVLRSQKQLDIKVTSVLTKRCKYGAKQSGQQSQGCLQIEHFFGKANRS